MNDPSTRLLTLYELAQALRMTRTKARLWLRDLAHSGAIPSIRPGGGLLRFSLRAVEAALLELAAKGDRAPSTSDASASAQATATAIRAAGFTPRLSAKGGGSGIRA